MSKQQLQPQIDDNCVQWGAAAIGLLINRNTRQTFYLLENGQLPGAVKIGDRWAMTPRAARAVLAGEVPIPPRAKSEPHKRKLARGKRAMSDYHEFLRAGVKRNIIVVDPDDAMDKLAMWSRRQTASGYVDLTEPTVHRYGLGRTWHYLDFAAREIVPLLSSISDGETHHRCAVCATRFNRGRQPLRFIRCWPLANIDDATDGSTWGLCSACSVRPTLLWEDALAVFARKRGEQYKRMDSALQMLLRAKRRGENEP